MKLLVNKNLDKWTEEHKVGAAMIFGWVMGVIIALLAVVFFSSVATGAQYADTPHCSNGWGDCEPPIITSTSPIYECITDTATATFLSVVNYEAGHTMEFNIETGEVTIDDKSIAEFSHPDLKILLKKIGEQLYESNQSWKRQCDFQTGMLLKALEKCETK